MESINVHATAASDTGTRYGAPAPGANGDQAPVEITLDPVPKNADSQSEYEVAIRSAC